MMQNHQKKDRKKISLKDSIFTIFGALKVIQRMFNEKKLTQCALNSGIMIINYYAK